MEATNLQRTCRVSNTLCSSNPCEAPLLCDEYSHPRQVRLHRGCCLWILTSHTAHKTGSTAHVCAPNSHARLTRNRGVPRAAGEQMKCLLKGRRESRLGFKIVQTGGEGVMRREGLGVRVLQLRDGKFIILFGLNKYLFIWLSLVLGASRGICCCRAPTLYCVQAQQLWNMGLAAPWHVPS